MKWITVHRYDCEDKTNHPILVNIENIVAIERRSDGVAIIDKGGSFDCYGQRFIVTTQPYKQIIDMVCP
jgi:hypothetical protein